MTDLIEKLKEIEDLCALKGCSDEQIAEAEAELGMKLPEEFVRYAKEFGCVDFGSTEWNGLNVDGCSNIVYATKREKSVNDAFPKGFFVLEDYAIDCKLAIVNEKGAVYLLQRSKKKKLCNSISEYLDMCIERDD